MTDEEIYSLAEDLETIGQNHGKKKIIRFIFLGKGFKNNERWSDFMHYFSGAKLISLSRQSVYSCIAHYEPKDGTGWAGRYYKGRTLEGPWFAVHKEIQTLKETFPNLDFIIRETDEHISYRRLDD